MLSLASLKLEETLRLQTTAPASLRVIYLSCCHQEHILLIVCMS